MIFLLLFAYPCVYTFNIDTNLPTIFTGPNDSYFGYTVQFTHVGTELKLVVSVPKYYTSKENDGGMPLFYCDILKNLCTSVVVPTTKDDIISETGHWLGASMEQLSKTDILVCSHLRSTILDRLPGSCYRMTNSTTKKEYTSFPTKYYETKKIFTQYGWITATHYQLAQSGISAHVLKDGSGFVLGAPGLKGWEGGTVYYLSDTHFEVFIHSKSTESEIFEIYGGYSVTSGKFFVVSQLYIAIGAPRYNNNGAVTVYSHTKKGKHRTDNNLNVVAKLEGQDMGEYFGATVCAFELTISSSSLLLVGAPLHPGNSYEEGKVYIFQANSGSFEFLKIGELLGSQKEGSRFGSTITSVGDLNLDTYSDLVIGAPYENEGTGAIYIYFGTNSELKFKIRYQRIEARELGNNLFGFGISVSTSEDVDENIYPDFAVGSFLSDHVVLLRSRPIVSIEVDFEANPPFIFLKSKNCSDSLMSCFQIQICFSYEGNEIPPEIDVSYKLEVERQRLNLGKPSRASLFKYGDMVNNSLTVSEEGTCLQNFSVRMKSVNIPFNEPITFKLTYKLNEKEMTNKAKNKLIKGFQPTIAMMDLDNSLSQSKEWAVYFAQICGDDSQCKTDLSITAELELKRNYFDPKFFANQFEVNVKVFKKGEAALEPQISFQTNGQINKIQATSKSNVKCDKVCTLDNIISEEGQTIEIALKVYLLIRTLNVPNLNITLSIKSKSKDINPENNIFLITMPIKEEVDITGKGITEDTTTENCKKTEDNCFIAQTYKIENRGQYPIKRASVEIYWPQITVDSQLNLFDFPKENLTEGCQLVNLNDTASAEHAKNKQKIKNSENNAILNCQDGPIVCNSFVVCDLKNLPEVGMYQHTIIIKAKLNVAAVKKLWGTFYTLTIVTYTKTQINYEVQPRALQNPNHANDSFTTTTSVRFGYPFPLLYVILGASLGLLFLIVMLVILIKFGFFTRKDKTKLERLKCQAEGSMERILDQDDINTDPGAPEPNNL